MYSDKGVWTKTTPDKTFQTKEPLTEAPGQKPSRTIEREFVQGGFVRIFCTRPTKSRGDWDVWRTLGGPGMCDEVWQGEGGHNWPKIAWRTLWTAPYRLTNNQSAKVPQNNWWNSWKGISPSVSEKRELLLASITSSLPSSWCPN